MIDYVQILKMHYLMHFSSREIGASLGCSKTTVNDFLKRFRDCKELSFPLKSDVSNGTLYDLLYQKKGGVSSSLLYVEPDCEAIYKVLAKKGQTLKRLWRKYNAVGNRPSPEGMRRPYSYRQFCKHFSDWLGAKNLTCRIPRFPGQNVELDFAGMQLRLKNLYTGDFNTKVTIFLATMSFSDYCYAEGLVKCNIQGWLAVNTNAVHFFGGVTPVTTNDNCKVAVIENRDWIDPVINKDFQEWADHYNTTLLPAKVRKPKFKPHVEGAVKIVTQHILVEMQEMVFYSLADLNAELWKRLAVMNAAPFTAKPSSRLEMFNSQEREMLLPLPGTDYEYLERKEVRVYQDFHIRFDKSFYSIPERFVKQKVEVRATISLLSIYSERGELVWKWVRSHSPGSWNTEPTHLPKMFSDYLQWSVPFFQGWASSIGVNTRAVIDKMLEGVEYPEQAYRKCMGVLGFAKKYSKEALEACCCEAVLRGRCSYNYIKNTLISFAEDPEESVVQRENTTSACVDTFKVDGNRYSLQALLEKQEEK
ncbi:MAG: IS21 family transposase [Sphaerochaeta sp.]|jgi:transposase|nr:IS21 family transposase [Sphaerochaeta sp.]